MLDLAKDFCRCGRFNVAGCTHFGECTRRLPPGTLDVAYCDRNLDQLADLPLDPKDWVDPSTIIFTYTPVEDPAVYANIWQGLLTIWPRQLDVKLHSSLCSPMLLSLKLCVWASARRWF